MGKRVRPASVIFGWIMKIFGVVAAGVVLAVLWRSGPAIAHAFHGMGGTYRELYDEQHAPGAAELRSGKKCQLVSVTSAAARAKQAAAHPLRTSSKDVLADDAVVVMCVPYPFADSPSCDVLARTYVDAVHPTTPFRMVVTGKPGARSNDCLVDYDSSGKNLPLTSRDAGR